MNDFTYDSEKTNKMLTEKNNSLLLWCLTLYLENDVLSLSLLVRWMPAVAWWPVITNYNPFRPTLWVKLSIDRAGLSLLTTYVETTNVNQWLCALSRSPRIASLSSHRQRRAPDNSSNRRRNCSGAYNASNIACNALQSVALAVPQSPHTIASWLLTRVLHKSVSKI